MFAEHLREILRHVEPAPKSFIKHLFVIATTVSGNRLRELHGEMSVIHPRPAAGDTVAGKRTRILHTNIGHQHLTVVVVNAVIEVEYDVPCLSTFRKGVTMHTNPFRSSHFGTDAVIFEQHRVISGFGLFMLMAEA